MDFCTPHFGKTLNEIGIADIQNFFSEERTETDQLEFKSINKRGCLSEKFPGIQKAVCGLLNSSGGLIIWVAPEGKKITGKNEEIYIGELTYFDQILEKDNVVSRISDSIVPLPNSVRVSVISSEGKSIIILEIDSSDYAPHQLSGIYFMRIDGQTKSAPHHYIEALFKKIKYPNIEAFPKINQIEVKEGKYNMKFSVFFFNWSPLQNEEMLSLE